MLSARPLGVEMALRLWPKISTSGRATISANLTGPHPPTAGRSPSKTPRGPFVRERLEPRAFSDGEVAHGPVIQTKHVSPPARRDRRPSRLRRFVVSAPGVTGITPCAGVQGVVRHARRPFTQGDARKITDGVPNRQPGTKERFREELPDPSTLWERRTGMAGRFDLGMRCRSQYSRLSTG